MTTLLRWQNEYRLLPLLLAASLVVLLACVAGVVWSETSLRPQVKYASLDTARRAYGEVVVDISTQADLVRLGFDTGHGARALSGLGVQEYFMPRTSRQFDQLDPAVRSCFEGQDRCTAVVVPLSAAQGEGFLAAHAAVPAGQMVFLLRCGRVAFKQIVEK
jgi:hypothetical protein